MLGIGVAKINQKHYWMEVEQKLTGYVSSTGHLTIGTRSQKHNRNR